LLVSVLLFKRDIDQEVDHIQVHRDWKSGLNQHEPQDDLGNNGKVEAGC